MIKKKRWHCLPGQPLTELDKQVMFWENKGKLVPTRDLIKTPEQIEGIRKSGVVNTGCLDAVAEMIRPESTPRRLIISACSIVRIIMPFLRVSITKAILRAFVPLSTKWFAMVFLRKRMCSKRAISSMWI